VWKVSIPRWPRILKLTNGITLPIPDILCQTSRMKRFLAPILLALTFSVTFSSTSFADWKELGNASDGDTFYVDFERIRKHEGYVYYWYLHDYLKPDEFGDLSAKLYIQGDCELFRFKNLSFSFHKEPMGSGIADAQEPEKNGWVYPPPNSAAESMLKSACAYAK
jgi:hypothetical protein